MLQIDSMLGSASQDGVIACWDVSDLYTLAAKPKPQPVIRSAPKHKKKTPTSSTSKQGLTAPEWIQIHSNQIAALYQERARVNA